MKLKNLLLLSAMTMSMAAVAQDYSVSYGADVFHTRTDRVFKSFSFKSNECDKTVEALQNKAMYAAKLNETFTAKPGEEVTVKIEDYNGGHWMHTFVYLDKGQDGEFSANATVTGTDANCTLNWDKTDDVMTFSFLSQSPSEDAHGRNSNNEHITGDPRNVLNPPAFTIPADLTPGAYRMRVKIDWSCIDPAGFKSTSGDIKSNGGGIVDVMLNVVGENTSLSSEATNGSVTLANGDALSTATAGTACPIKITPDAGYALETMTITYGFNLSGAATDSHGNPQYQTATINVSEVAADGSYTIPAEYMLGEVKVTPTFASSDSFVNLTYTLMLGSETLKTKAINNVKVGEAYPAHGFTFETSSEYYTLEGVPTGNVTADNTNITITVTEKLPFEKGEGVVDGDFLQWYTLKCKNIYLKSDSTATSISLPTNGPTRFDAVPNEYKWAFFGNVYEGFEIRNYIDLRTKALTAGDPTKDSNKGGDTRAYCKDTESLGADDVNRWMLVKSNHDSASGRAAVEHGFYLAQKGRPSAKLNNRDNFLAFWIDGADFGSEFEVAPTGTWTSIESVEATKAQPNGPIYDIYGRVVTNLTPGIYIQNGKKFIVR